MKVKKFPFGIIILSLFLSCAQQSEKKHTLVSVVNHPLWSQNKTIYQVNLRQFSTAGDFNSLGERLPELKKLGIGIIWLLPVYPIGGNNSGDTTKNFYAVKDFKAISPDLGNEDDFLDLIKAINLPGIPKFLSYLFLPLIILYFYQMEPFVKKIFIKKKSKKVEQLLINTKTLIFNKDINVSIEDKEVI